MTKERKKFGKGKIAAVVISGLCCLFAIFLIVVNIFIPLKYLSAYLTAANANPAGQMRVTFLDVGYGDCTIVEFPDGKTMLVDGGNGSYPQNQKVLKALNQRGIKNIDYLVCSSACPERCGGLSEVLKYKTASVVYVPYFPLSYYNGEYRNFCEALSKSGITPDICEYGAGVFNDEEGYNFCFLSPSNHLIETGESSVFIKNPTKENANNASAVLWIEYCGIGFLLTGNGGEEVQKKLISLASVGFEVNGRTLNIAGCSVLKVPDHGSAFAAYGGLYEFLSPKAAIISVGDNTEGSPSLQALSGAQEAADGNIYRTDEDGSVTVTVSGGTFKIEKEKK